MPDSKFTPENIRIICERLWEGEAVKAIAQDIGVHRSTIYDWADAHPEFGKKFERAMKGGARTMVDEIIPIIDNTEEDAQSRKVRAWGRLEIAKRKAPELFGDKVDMNHSGSANFSLTVNRKHAKPA